MSPAAIDRLFTLAALAFGGAVFAAMLARGVESDIPAHARFVEVGLQARALPENFLYYLCVAVFAFGSTDSGRPAAASAAVLAVAVAARFAVSVRLARSLTAGAEGGSSAGASAPAKWLLPVGVFALLVAHNLFVPPASLSRDRWRDFLAFDRLYIGWFPPNVWHNSTTIFLMPAALLLFHRSWSFLESGRTSHLPVLAGLALLNVVIKPSYFLVFAVVFPMFALLRLGLDRRIVWAALSLVPAAAFVVLQQLGSFRGADSLPWHTADSGVTLDFGAAWRAWTGGAVALPLVLSLAYPLLFAAIRPRALSDGPLGHAWMQVAVALLIFALAAETGVRSSHFNFVWQAFVCSNMLFLITFAVHLRVVAGQGRLARCDYALFGCLALHVAAGAVYIAKMLYFRTYV